MMGVLMVVTGRKRMAPAPFGCWALLMVCLAGLCTSTPASAGQSARPRPGIARNAWDADVVAKQELDRDGWVRLGKDVALWYPADSLADEQAKAIVQRLDRGIRAAKHFIGQQDWQVQGDRRIHFYCPSGRFVSHAPGGNCAFIPLWRMRNDESPWLHEALHLLLATPKGDWIAAEDSVSRETGSPIERLKSEWITEIGLVRSAP